MNTDRHRYFLILKNPENLCSSVFICGQFSFNFVVLFNRTRSGINSFDARLIHDINV